MALSPLVFAGVLLSKPTDPAGLCEDGVGGGAIAVPLFGMAGGFALSGRGPRWARLVAGLVALAPIPLWALTATSVGGSVWRSTLRAAPGWLSTSGRSSPSSPWPAPSRTGKCGPRECDALKPRIVFAPELGCPTHEGSRGEALSRRDWDRDSCGWRRRPGARRAGALSGADWASPKWLRLRSRPARCRRRECRLRRRTIV